MSDGLRSSQRFPDPRTPTDRWSKHRRGSFSQLSMPTPLRMHQDTVIRFRPTAPQRDMLCDLVRVLGEDLNMVCQASIGAERDGKVDRPRGAEDLTPATHAKALWNEGKLEGWIAR